MLSLEIILERNKLLRILPTVHKSWELTFDIKLFHEAKEDRNVLRFTMDNENGFGSKVPSIDVIARSTKLRFYLPHEARHSRKFEMTENLNPLEWHSVRMKQYQVMRGSVESFNT